MTDKQTDLPPARVTTRRLGEKPTQDRLVTVFEDALAHEFALQNQELLDATGLIVGWEAGYQWALRQLRDNPTLFGLALVALAVREVANPWREDGRRIPSEDLDAVGQIAERLGRAPTAGEMKVSFPLAGGYTDADRAALLHAWAIRRGYPR